MTSETRSEPASAPATAPFPYSTRHPWIVDVILAVVSSVTLNWSLLRLHDQVLPKDWFAFNQFSLVLRSSWLSYGRPPLHNPWLCGGVDVLGNPQLHTFSPLMLLDLAFSPQTANLLCLVVIGVLGFVVTRAWLTDLGCELAVARLCAFKWLACGFFAFHFAEGHIIYAEMQLLPALQWLWRRKHTAWGFWLLCMVVGLMALDGAQYTVVYGGLIIAAWMVTFSSGSIPTPMPPRDLRPWFAAVSAAGLLCWLASRLVPSAVVLASKPPNRDQFNTSLAGILKALFDPMQNMYTPKPGAFPHGYHELSCYIGIPLVVIVTAWFFRGGWRTGWRMLAAAALLFWLASGWGDDFNPWWIYSRTPYINYAHIQSRAFITVAVLATGLVGMALQAMKSGRFGKIIYAATALVFLVEGSWVRNYPMATWRISPMPMPPRTTAGHGLPVGRNDLMHGTTLQTTVDFPVFPDSWLEGIGSKACYDPSTRPSPVRHNRQPDYHGEAFVVEGLGQAAIVSLIPGVLKIDYNGPVGSHVIVNLREFGWSTASGPLQVVQSDDGRLTLEATGPRGLAELHYDPWHVPFAWSAWALGCVLLGATGAWLWRKRRKVTALPT